MNYKSIINRKEDGDCISDRSFMIAGLRPKITNSLYR